MKVSKSVLDRMNVASLPEVVTFKLLMEDAEPVCPEKPVTVAEMSVCEVGD